MPRKAARWTLFAKFQISTVVLGNMAAPISPMPLIEIRFLHPGRVLATAVISAFGCFSCSLRKVTQIKTPTPIYVPSPTSARYFIWRQAIKLPSARWRWLQSSKSDAQIEGQRTIQTADLPTQAQHSHARVPRQCRRGKLSDLFLGCASPPA